MKKIRIHDTRGNSLVENVIILPLVFILIYALIFLAFTMYDKVMIDSAVQRGAAYASKIIADPNYAAIVNDARSEDDILDTGIGDASAIRFDGVGNNVMPYRYISGSFKSYLEPLVKDETYSIIESMKIPWSRVDADDVSVTTKNYVVYQNVTVSAKVHFPINPLFTLVGFPDEFEYEAKTTVSVNDPDEFIRNADLIVDVIVDIDGKTGGHLEKVKKMMEEFTTKIKTSTFAKFINLE